MKLPTLGRVELISVLGRTNVPAKVDTGQIALLFGPAISE